jgi:hypothetical protein
MKTLNDGMTKKVGELFIIPIMTGGHFPSIKEAAMVKNIKCLILKFKL